MILYTCGRGKGGPAAFIHPCARAARALEAAGYEFEVKPVKGFRLIPRSRCEKDEARAEVRKLSGWNDVPVLVLDNGEVFSGSGVIIRWAKETPRAGGMGAPAASKG